MLVTQGILPPAECPHHVNRVFIVHTNHTFFSYPHWLDVYVLLYFTQLYPLSEVLIGSLGPSLAVFNVPCPFYVARPPFPCKCSIIVLHNFCFVSRAQWHLDCILCGFCLPKLHPSSISPRLCCSILPIRLKCSVLLSLSGKTMM